VTDYPLNLLTLHLSPVSVQSARPTVPVPTLPGLDVTLWVAKAVTLIGSIAATYTVLTPPSIVWTLDGFRVATFDLPIDEPDIAQLPLTGKTTPPHEVQLFRNGHLIFWGPVIQRRVNNQQRVWNYTAADPLWYLLGRNMGEANRHNYLTNGNFEASTAGWTQVGAFASSIDATRFMLGSASLKVDPGASGGDQFFRQRFTIHAGAAGLALFLTAWVYVDSFAAGALGNRGAFLQRLGGVGPGALGIAAVDGSTPLGSWQRLACHVNMPPNSTETIEARLYAWDGTGHWDAVTVTIMESVSMIDLNSPGSAGWDQVQIAQQVCRYLSGAWRIGGTYTKSNLRLAVAGALSGIKKERTYQFMDHQPGYQGGVGNGALDEWPRSNAGFDFRIDYDSLTKRTFRTYFPAVGHTWTAAEIQGLSLVTHATFEYTNNLDGTGVSWGIVGYDFGETIQGSYTDICELGNSPVDSGREEGAFSDDTALGGLTLELVEAAPTGAPIDLLDAVAAQRGGQLAKPIATPTLVMVEPRDPTTQVVVRPLIDRLLPGDLIPVVVNDASVQLSGVFRVTQVTLNPDETLSVVIAP
jgi:hypothetical protein